jgi:hypothetical protein
MSRPPPQSYLLRLWREHQGAPLRATLVPVARPDLQQHFADVGALYAFLCAQADADPMLKDDVCTTHCTRSKSS